MEPEKQASRPNIVAALLVLVVALGGYYLLGGRDRWPFNKPAPETVETSKAPSGPQTVELTPKQMLTIKVGKVDAREFQVVKPAVGNVDFNQDLSTQVSSPYQGRVIQVFVDLGDRVTRGQPLFTIESPDLMTAESTLVQTAGVLDLANANLVRLRGATKLGGTAQKDLDQAISDQKTAEGNDKAARLAMTVFGKTGEEIDRIARERKLDPTLVVRSPNDGIVSARSAAPGQLVQPGVAPAPLTISDDSSMWLNAYVVERDAAAMHVGDSVVARVPAASEDIFTGKVTRVGSVLDPNTHRLLARAVIADPDHKLRAGMIATFMITTDRPVVSPSIPKSGVVREGDGSMTVWVQKDETHFVQRVVKIGIQQDGVDQVLDGLQAGESVIVDGALFVDNILNAGPTD